jgi:hypothetical protein
MTYPIFLSYDIILHLSIIQNMLGYKNIATTDTYVRIDSTMLKDEILHHPPSNLKNITFLLVFSNSLFYFHPIFGRGLILISLEDSIKIGNIRKPTFKSNISNTLCCFC